MLRGLVCVHISDCILSHSSLEYQSKCVKYLVFVRLPDLCSFSHVLFRINTNTYSLIKSAQCTSSPVESRNSF